MTIRVILVDDEIQSVNNLMTLLAGFTDIRVTGTVTNPQHAVAMILDQCPDLLFLDVQMPGKDGFEIVRELHENKCNPGIIFVTAFNQYAIDAIRSSAFDYLLKPVDPGELEAAISRFIKTRETDSENRYESLLDKIPPHGKIKFNTNSGFILLRPEEIIYIKADWNYSEIFLDNERQELVTTNLGSLEKLLPTGFFYRVSRSTIINLTYLSKVNRKKRTVLLLKNGLEYPVRVPLLNIRKMERQLEGK